MTIIIIIIAVILITIIIASVSSSNETGLKPGEKRIEISFPNPATCTKGEFQAFVNKTPVYKLEPLLKAIDERGIYLSYELRGIIENKINGFNYQINKSYSFPERVIQEDNIIELKGVHLTHRKNLLLETCSEGDLVDLKPEPLNEFDSNAVQVRKYGRLLGYLDSERTDFYHDNKDFIKQAIIKTIDFDGDYLYVEILIELFSEDEIYLHSEYEDLKTNKISREYLYPRKDIIDTNNYFYGKKVVITGAFDNFPYRNEMAMMLWEVGADVDLKVSSSTDIVIIGKNAGWRKQEQVLETQAECIDEETFMRHFHDYKPKFN